HSSRNARGIEGLGAASAGRDGGRSHHGLEMDAPFAAETLQGPSTTRNQGLAAHGGALAATTIVFVAYLPQTTSGHPQSRPRLAVSLLDSAATTLHNSWL